MCNVYFNLLPPKVLPPSTFTLYYAGGISTKISPRK